ncbi:hypothetical protein GOP47_0028179 [Adiantum capillus-veneris]|nr:hypothetical protein GOP47_0028179 [Adiantum capillus-veneris]
MVRAPCCPEDKEGLRKGAWTEDEDEKLVAFIKKNKGHGSWRTLPKLAGLERCGKSCRLRWTNYLRPNIKRGNFSGHEESIIIQLHAVLGNKWSSIASHLPGRTDNEVKNHWNTHLKKRLSKMGIDPATHLPLNMFPSHHHLYGNLSAYNQRSCVNNSDWQKVLLQQSLKLDPSIACHLVQWELARVEAETRQKLASSHGTYIQNYLASWLQSLQQNQAPTYDLNALHHATNFQPRALTEKLVSNFSNMLPNKPNNHDSQPFNNNLVDNYQPASRDGNETSPSSTLLSKHCLNVNKQGIEHMYQDHVLASTTNSIGTPDTCTSNDSLSSHLLSNEFLIPDDLVSLDLSSNESYNPIANCDPTESSSVSINDHTSQHDSYWNRVLNLLGHATFENL